MSQCNSEQVTDKEETGVVVALEGRFAYIERIHLAGCKNCAMHGLCGSKDNPKLKFYNNIHLQVGDFVQININAGLRIFSSFIVFVFPIIMLFIFLVIGMLFKLSEKISVLMAFGGLILAFLIVWMIDKYIGLKNKISLTKINPEDIDAHRNQEDAYEDSSQ